MATITGTAENDSLSGTELGDTISGLGGNDYLLGLGGSDTIDGGEGEDYLSGGDGNGSDGGAADIVNGGAGNDRISAGYGDTIDGGDGNDTLYLSLFNGATAGVNLDLRQLVGNGTVSVGGAAISNVEYVAGISLTDFSDTVIAGPVPGASSDFIVSIDGWGGNDDLTGSAGIDWINGGDGDDIIHGGLGVVDDMVPGVDRLSGEAGNDTIYIGADGAYAYGGTGDDTVNGGEGYDEIWGEYGADILFGNGGDDGIQGGGDNDTLDGGEGNDTLVGDLGDDLLKGGAGNDILIGESSGGGSPGADLMYGGTGDDEFHVENTDQKVFENAGEGTDTVVTFLSYVLPSNVENLNLVGFVEGAQSGTGNALANVIYAGWSQASLYGLGGNDHLYGGSESDLLDGGAGGDIMQGGAGNDTYYVGNAFDQVIENASEGNDTVYSTISYTLGANLDNLRLLGTASINATGNSRTNVLVGNDGNNDLNGGLGADKMGGGKGNDTYHVDNAGDQVIENASSGTDTVFSTISYTLGANVETLRLQGSAAINATGNDFGNVLAGNSGANTLDGGAGNDKLLGGKGTDQLWGGAGADEFAFGTGHFGGFTAATAERVHDFSHAEGDRIGLDQIDANTLVDGNQSFTFIGNQSFHGVAGELRYVQSPSYTYIYGDTDGDGTADFLVLLDGVHSLTGGDFIL